MEDWDRIMAREGPAVWRTIHRLLANRADADECFQETFLGAWQMASREPLRDVRAVLLRLATARSVDRLRARYRQRRREDQTEWDDHPAAGASPGQCAEAAELSDRLRDALAELAPKQAEAFCLFSLEGWSYQEIAAHLDSSIDAVGVLLHRARAKLRGLLSPVEREMS